MRGRDDCHVRFSYDGSVTQGPALQTNFAILPHSIFHRSRGSYFFTVVFQRGEGRGGGFGRTWEPVQSHGAMSSPRSGPAKQNLQEFVGSQNRQLISSSSSSSRASGRSFWSRMSPGTSFASVKRQELEQHLLGGLGGSSISRSRASLSATQWLRSSQSVKPVPMKMSPARDMAAAFAGMPRFFFSSRGPDSFPRDQLRRPRRDVSSRRRNRRHVALVNKRRDATKMRARDRSWPIARLVVAAAQRSTNSIFTSLKTARKEIFENSRSPLLPRWRSPGRVEALVVSGASPAALQRRARLSMYSIDRPPTSQTPYASPPYRATCPSALRASAVVSRSGRVHDDFFFAAVSQLARASRSRW